MPKRNTPSNTARYTGWYNDQVNNVLELFYNGTKVAQASASAFTITGALSSPGAISSTTTITAGTTLASTTTTTVGTGLTVTTGNTTNTAGDVRVTAGNVRLGVVSAFATTEPTSAVVFKSGTAFAGAITTSGGLMSSDTVVRKIIADGTVSNVET
jgi:hypothetical protein